MCFFAIIYCEDTDISTFVAYTAKYAAFKKYITVLPVFNYGFY
jgi:hypothetical protein